MASGILLTLGITAAGALVPHTAVDAGVEARIDSLMASMTLEQKIGQMVQLEVNMITYSDHGYNHDSLGFRLDSDKLDYAFGTHYVGSILNMLGGVHAADPHTWNRVTRQIVDASRRHGAGIPCVYGLDQVHGTTYSAGGTLFPQQIGVAATFNRSLARHMGEISAYETKACGVPWNFGPNFDVARKPSWPRLYETFGEDPYLVAQIGVAYLSGLQGTDPKNIGPYNVGTCLKHYLGYGIPDNGIDRTPANISEHELREKHFVPFRRGVEAGALAVMTNSSILNGMNGVANRRYITEWLKDSLQFTGVVVTDWGDIENLRIRDHIADTQKDAIRMAVNAGVDMMMVPSQFSYGTLLRELVEEGDVTIDRINDATRRILRMKHRLGLFDRSHPELSDYPLYGSDEYAAAARQTAVESAVLLKNDNQTLPIPTGKKILVCGPNADTMRGLNGGWSYSWQGSNVQSFSSSYSTILSAMRDKFGSENIIYEPGVTYNEEGDWQMENTPEIDRAVARAADVDYILACIGENSYAETIGNIADLSLSSNQSALVKALQQTGKPVILILNQGRPRIIRDLVPGADAIVNIMLPGNYGGLALADLLAGDQNFSGRLPFTYPSYPNSLTTYDYKICEKRDTMPGTYNYEAHTDVQWWFGHGLSYTTFSYDNLCVTSTDFSPSDTITVSVNVTNTGSRPGKETVMLYSSDLFASIIPDSRRLRGFDKVELAPGQTAKVTFAIPATDLAFVGSDGKWHLEKGDFTINVGPLKQTLTCRESKQWNTF